MDKMDAVLKIMDNEPDYHIFPHKGLICEVARHPSQGHYCGYVLVPKGHKLYEMGYDEAYGMADINVHGGLTYADSHNEYWALGFDCNHGGDFNVPQDERIRELSKEFLHGGIYRDFEYVKGECESLAESFGGEEIDDIDAIIAKMILSKK